MADCLFSTRRMLVACTAFLLAVSPRAAKAQAGVVHGAVVHGGTHARIPGARVTIVGTNLSAVTGADGSYRFTGVPEGERTIEATLPGFQTGGSGCVRVPEGGAGIAIPIIPVGYVLPPLRPRINRHTGAPMLAPIFVINGLRYPQDYEPKPTPGQIESLEIIRAPEVGQRYPTCVPNGGAILIELLVLGEGNLVAQVVDAATGATLTEVMFGLDSMRPNLLAPSGRFSWSTRRTDVGLAVERFGYRSYTLPCRLKIPVGDSVSVRVWLSALPADQQIADLARGPGGWRAPSTPLSVVNDTVWAPGPAAPIIPPEYIVSVEVLTRTAATARYGQCGSAGAVLITTSRPPS